MLLFYFLLLSADEPCPAVPRVYSVIASDELYIFFILLYFILLINTVVLHSILLLKLCSARKR